MKILLNSQERLLILDALDHPAYKDKVTLPKTPYIVRQVYKGLKEKLIEKEAKTLKPTLAIEALKSESRFITFQKPKMNKQELLQSDIKLVQLDVAIHYLEDL